MKSEFGKVQTSNNFDINPTKDELANPPSSSSSSSSSSYNNNEYNNNQSSFGSKQQIQKPLYEVATEIEKPHKDNNPNDLVRRQNAYIAQGDGKRTTTENRRKRRKILDKVLQDDESKPTK